MSRWIDVLPFWVSQTFEQSTIHGGDHTRMMQSNDLQLVITISHRTFGQARLKPSLPSRAAAVETQPFLLTLGQV